MPCVCGSNRTASVSGKCADSCNFSSEEYEHVGYVPGNVGVGRGGDYISLVYCLSCGRIQGSFPISEEAVQEALREE